MADATPTLYTIDATTNQHAGYLLWGGWLLSALAVFSEARFINAYYVAILTPAICALAGIGMVVLWRRYHAALTPGDDTQRRILSGLLLPLALLATGAEQLNLMRATPNWPNLGALALPCAVMAMALGLGGWLFAANHPGARRSQEATRAQPSQAGWEKPLASAFAAVGLCATLIAPLAWSSLSLTWGNSNGWPVAGPQYAALQPAPKLFVDPYLTRYLLAHRDGARYVVATTDTYYASQIIVKTGLPVMAMGGFSGADPVLTPQMLERLVDQNAVRYFLLPSSNVTRQQFLTLFPQAISIRSGASLAVQRSAAPGRAGSPRLSIPTNLGQYTNALTAWVSQHCAPVPPQQWSSATYVHYRLGATQLYVCHAHTQAHHPLRHRGHPGSRHSGGGHSRRL